jgi:hypothetical protein
VLCEMGNLGVCTDMETTRKGIIRVMSGECRSCLRAVGRVFHR